MRKTMSKVCAGCFYILILTFVFNCPQYASAETTISVKLNRTSATYLCEDRADFSILIERNGIPPKKGEAFIKLTNDGYASIKKTTIQMKNAPRPIKISGTLKKPGFLRCTVEYNDGTGIIRGYGAAAFEPERIQAEGIRPDDFDEFWTQGLARLKSIPMDEELTLLHEYSNRRHRCYKISFANINNTRMYGYLNVPSKKPAKYPVLIEIPGAGVSGPKKPLTSDDTLILYMSVHDYEVGLPSEKYQEFAERYKRNSSYTTDNYLFSGGPDREKFIFRRALIGLSRAVDYMASRKDFDGEHLVLQGSSQGGFVVLALAGLNKKITAVASNQPAFCDHAGYLAGRTPGAPLLVLKPPDAQRKKWLRMSNYYDTVNFAENITCPVILGVGFIDVVCPPSSVYAAYNVITAPKNIVNMTTSGHSSDSFNPGRNRWVAVQLGLR